jgi:hypothetical protein
MNTRFSHEDRADFASAAIRVLNEWGVEPQDQVTLLGMPENTRPRALLRHANGTPLPDENNLHLRIKHLLSIEHSLATAFPHNTALANYWVTTANQYFGNRTPLDIMLEHGVDGMETVARFLDNSDGGY